MWGFVLTQGEGETVQGRVRLKSIPKADTVEAMEGVAKEDARGSREGRSGGLRSTEKMRLAAKEDGALIRGEEQTS